MGWSFERGPIAQQGNGKGQRSKLARKPELIVPRRSSSLGLGRSATAVTIGDRSFEPPTHPS